MGTELNGSFSFSLLEVFCMFNYKIAGDETIYVS